MKVYVIDLDSELGLYEDYLLVTSDTFENAVKKIQPLYKKVYNAINKTIK